MRAKLSTILSASLEDLKSLSETPDTFISEKFEITPVETILAESKIEVEERGKSHDDLRDMLEDYIENHEAEHERLEDEIDDVRETVSSVVVALEMLSMTTSMESVTDNDVVMANTVISQVSAMVKGEAPVLEAEEGKFTTVSLEGLTDFIKKTLRKISDMIKFKYNNMVTSFRRSAGMGAAFEKRIHFVRERLESLPDEYGIPAAKMRYTPKFVTGLYRDKNTIELTPTALGKAIDEVITLYRGGRDQVIMDGVKRSTTINQALPSIMAKRDTYEIEKDMKALFSSVTGGWSVDKLVKFGNEYAGGVTYHDAKLTSRLNYRDAAWIVDLLTESNIVGLNVHERSSGNYSDGVADVGDLLDVIDKVTEGVDGLEMNDYTWYNDLARAWQDAQNAWNHMYEMCVAMSMEAMTDELWRAIDAASTAMFMFLEKAFLDNYSLQLPILRLLHSALYVVEEQAKEYVKVNR